MAGQKIEKDSPLWGIWGDLWKMLQEYAIPEDNEAYWGGLVQRAHDIERKYNHHPLAARCALAVIWTLEDIWKESANAGRN